MNMAIVKLVFGQALNCSRSKGGIWVSYLAFGLTTLLLVLDALAFFFADDAKKVMVFGLVIVATQVVLVWGPVTKVVPLLVTPSNGQLVPGLRRGVMWVMVVSWAIVVLFFAIAGGYATGHVLRAGGMAAVMLGGLALLSIGRWEGFFPYILGIFIALERLKFAGVDERGATAILTVIAVLTSVYAFFRMFPSGDRHWRSMDALEKARLVERGQAAQTVYKFSIWRWAYAKVLAQDCQQPQAGSGKLLWHALGPSAHWSSPVIACLLLQVSVVLNLWLLPKFGLSPSFWQGFAIGISATAVLFGQFWHLQQIAIRMHATRAEQELVRLSPRIPQNEALKQLLVKDALWQSAGMFGLVLLTTLFVSVVADDPPATTLTRLLQVSLTVLASVGVLRAVTRTGNPGSIWPPILVLLQMLVVGIAFATAYPALSASMAQPWLVLAVASFVLAGVLLWRDVRRVLQGPPVWPLALA